MVVKTVFSHQRISQMAVRTSLERQLDPMCQIASRGWLVPVFLRKPEACDLPVDGGGGGGSEPPVAPAGSACDQSLHIATSFVSCYILVLQLVSVK